MGNNIENAVYCQLVDLVKAIINQIHLGKFGISKAIYDEIVEEISRSGENIEQLTQ
jgi:predicted nucleic acid-binding protein